ncbi:MAG: Hsp20/alpha crystallin family protein [Anaerolineales bacterium]|nr:Hsp20/alpha crystallin family protein [Anaerolineales bacterium]
MPRVIRKRQSSTFSEMQHTVMHSVGWPHVHAFSNAWSPATDMYEVEKSFIVRIEAAGLREEDFSVSMEDNFLVVRGVRQDIQERRAYHQMEIQFGRFSSVVGIPGQVDVEKATAEYQDGFLTIVLPKLD